MRQVILESIGAAMLVAVVSGTVAAQAVRIDIGMRIPPVDARIAYGSQPGYQADGRYGAGRDVLPDDLEYRRMLIEHERELLQEWREHEREYGHDPRAHGQRDASLPTEEEIIDRVRGSLERLRTDYVDAYILFVPRTLAALNYSAYHSAIARLKAEGRVRFTGVSHHGASPEWGDSMTDILSAADDDGRFDVVVTVYNFMNHEQSDPVIAACTRNDVGTIAIKTAPGTVRYEPWDPDNFTEEQQRYFEWLMQQGSSRECALQQLEDAVQQRRDLFERTRPFVERYGLQTEEQLRLVSIHWAIQNPAMHTACVTLGDYDFMDKVVALSGTELAPAEEDLLRECEIALNDL